MKKKLIALIFAALLAVATIAPVVADGPPPGLRGYEGQPGHHGGPQHNP